MAPAFGETRERLEQLFAVAVAVWSSEGEARAFFFRPHPMLNDDTPFHVAFRSEEGARLVERIFGRLQHGTTS
ncbi:antitoxin Xre/MbcA/ParS toxin-binding domain-containing protein [Sabulicella rubraurantiaca]|uniref:antitoxin Xre/MbcA/ParS toxin-binding domain-containing protein n=1 Tax=Sabulicella rubraurantiaca TaxID=2811429 RepID=UPI001A95763C|nr:antitoxin Xre/MbcA/ParS toxin-binding domain-containing protein [Sabulicella rubraurantiaca]